jgi:hypothetical protein
MKSLKKTFRWLMFSLLVLFGAIQLIRPERTNPPVDQNKIIQEHLQIPTEIGSILRRSCYDCHSNETVWPWYSNVAPASWLVADDVSKARRMMNFSEWGNYKLGKVLSLLEGICEETSNGDMPLSQYTFMHPATGLSQVEIKALCDWSQAEAQRLTGGGQE